MKKRDERLRKLKKIVLPILRKGGVSKAAVFGSFARGEKKYHDIDILVKFKGRKSLFDLVGLEQELGEILRKKVELLTYKSIHPLIKKHILSEKVEIL
ncbi:MAG: nucleotidyltransferase family protein [Nanoarchaeota archaeon]